MNKDLAKTWLTVTVIKVALSGVLTGSERALGSGGPPSKCSS